MAGGKLKQTTVKSIYRGEKVAGKAVQLETSQIAVRRQVSQQVIGAVMRIKVSSLIQKVAI